VLNYLRAAKVLKPGETFNPSEKSRMGIG
jgi:hypothetical protein